MIQGGYADLVALIHLSLVRALAKLPAGLELRELLLGVGLSSIAVVWVGDGGL